MGEGYKMTEVIREGDDAQYHGWSPLCYPIGCSQDVLTNGIPTARIGDVYAPPVHCIPLVCHIVGWAVEGSADVMVNGLGVHRKDDMIKCGAVAGTVFSSDVIANG